MNPQELRIGNLFHPCSTRGGITIPSTDIIWKVAMIDKFGKIGVIEPENHESIFLPINECSPIPLTEEWLTKFGFVYRTDTGFNGWYSIPVLGESIRIFEVENNWFKYHSATTVIKHVHSLQNLFFCLCGEELQIQNL